jgi:threonine/homoserine/homoserine lactone efflux protein
MLGFTVLWLACGVHLLFFATQALYSARGMNFSGGQNGKR